MSRVELGDSIQLIKTVETESVHLILSDIPYGINYDEWDVLHKNPKQLILKIECIKLPVMAEGSGILQKSG